MGLLSLLFGGGQAAAQAAQPPNQFGYDPNGYLTAVPNGGGNVPQPQAAPAPSPGSLVQHLATVAPTAPLAQGPQATPPQQPQQGDDITVTGDNWRPKKASVLGQIADYFLDTHFGRNTVRQNMEGALQHLTSNPDEAIRRMAMFDPEEAEKLYQHVSSVKHYNGMLDRQNLALDDLEEQRIFQRAGNMAAVANADNWPQMRSQIVQMAAARGDKLGQEMDTMLPKDYDPNAAQYISAGAMPVKAQVQAAETNRHHTVSEQQQEGHYGDQRQYYQGIVRNGATNAATGQARQQEQVAHDTTTEGQTQDKINQKPPQMTVKMTKYGPMEVTGNSAVLRRPDGTSLRYITTDGVNWVPTHQKPKGSK